MLVSTSNSTSVRVG